jgi:spore maturation protein CgeB
MQINISQVLDPIHRVIIIGASGGTHLGSSLERASRKLKYPTTFLNIKEAYGNGLQQKLLWHFDRVPQYLKYFSKNILREVDIFNPTIVIVIGTAPISIEALKMMKQKKIILVNWSTDDPWNPAHKSSWIFKALQGYDFIFTPRLSNIFDFQNVTSATVNYLPFGYDDELFPEIEDLSLALEEKNTTGKVLFVGGCDRDRIKLIKPLIRSGINIQLYGSYWNRYLVTRKKTGGIADVESIRLATLNSPISLCLVRRANRDGHVMRSFEIAASGGVPLIEDTPEHHYIYGETESCLFFNSDKDLKDKIKILLNEKEYREKIRLNAYKRIRSHKNSYINRLRKILNTVDECNKKKEKILK